MSKHYFGTDGIRGRVGEHPITPDFMLKLGWAAGKVLARHANGSRKLILIGKDTRISGYMFESALESGLISAGVDVGLLGPMPTPAIAYLTRTFNAQAGIVISASHNPHEDNGIKFFCGEGRKLPDDVEHEIEAQLNEIMSIDDPTLLGKARRIGDAAGRYIEFCKSTVPFGFHLRGLRIVVDCANGATYHIAPNVLRELGAEVFELAVKPDGLNINQNCGSTHPGELQRAVLEQSAHLGIAFDGDGDRVLFVDHYGEVVDGDELLYIIAHDQRARGKCKGVVGTLMSNLGFELALQELGIPFIRTKVGDRFVIEAMQKNGWDLGGESSGHIVCNHVTTTGDGVVSALQVLLALRNSGKSIAEMKCGMHKFPQVMINVRAGQKFDLAAYPQIANAIKATEDKLGAQGRVLLRPSGTEPVVRVMVEGADPELVRPLAVDLAAIVETALS
ncbi:MAG TPA: phosphoglucosamine mutase [Pseudomonadales bacterium]|nr:phosphoglucosamine mutase [Pseudomonadales bacterium]